MFRDPSLVPLSHQHQHGLALSVIIDRGLKADPTPAKAGELAQKVATMAEVELLGHFKVEEKVLFPAVRAALEDDGVVDELIAQHRAMEDLLDRLAAADDAARVGFGHSPDLEPMPGFVTGEKLRKLGWNASDTRELILEDVEVPEENVLGEVDRGFSIFLDTLDGGRVGMAAHAIGIAQGALDQAVRYTAGRKQFNKRIQDFQGVRFMLAEAETRIHAARLMMHHAARLRMSGGRHKKEAAMAKLFASETAMDVTSMAVQLHGGYGYSREYPVERMMRDAKITEIGEGTSEILKIVISREVLREAGTLA